MLAWAVHYLWRNGCLGKMSFYRRMRTRWKRIWNRIREAFEEGVHQQITRLGLVFISTIVLVGLAAFGSANNLLFLLFAVLLSALLVSGLVSRLGLAGLELDLKLPEHVAARRPVRARADRGQS